MNIAELIQRNSFIVKYMGASISGSILDEKSICTFTTQPAQFSVCLWRLGDLQYHSNWAWLMPVVEKIMQDEFSCEPIHYYSSDNTVNYKYKARFYNQPLHESETLIMATFLAVSDFIKQNIKL